MDQNTLKGWIQAPFSDKALLEEMGAVLENFDPETETWKCTVPISFLDKADKFWGTWLWGLS